jgi:hypothetical protein
MASRAAGGALGIFGIFVLAAASGCAGARYEVRADQARYPISMSPALPDSDGTILYVDHGLVPVGRFTEEVTKLGFFYGATGGTLDLSDVVNEQVAAHGGDGVADLAIDSRHCKTNWFFPFTLLPIWPGCESVIVTGVVVKSNRGGAPAPRVAQGPAGGQR